MGHKPAADKSFTYFALLEAFDKQGCPVCRLVMDASLSYLDTLFYEQVNDVGVRRKLRASRGFCNWHAWQARQITSSALGVALIANDLISEELARLDTLLRVSTRQHGHQGERGKIALKAIRAFIKGWQRKAQCPACRVVLDHQRHALETVINFLHDADFMRRFERSSPVCILHTTVALENHSRHPELRRLLVLQRQKYAQLGSALQEFCRKHDYQSTHEPWGPESDAWLRAIEILAGKPALFGNDIHFWRPDKADLRGWHTLSQWWREWVLRWLRRSPV
jgi:hypothetical protein